MEPKPPAAPMWQATTSTQLQTLELNPDSIVVVYVSIPWESTEPKEVCDLLERVRDMIKSELDKATPPRTEEDWQTMPDSYRGIVVLPADFKIGVVSSEEVIELLKRSVAKDREPEALDQA